MAMPVTDDDIRRSQLRRMGLESDLKEQELAALKDLMGPHARPAGPSYGMPGGPGPTMGTSGFVKGGPVTGKYTKGTGPVNIGDWTAPMKSRR